VGKFKELRDHLNQLDKESERAVRAVETKLNQHARKAASDLDRESKKFSNRIVNLEKRVAYLERRLRKAK
jgi:polyhydroxyalkanoate synthesis regulator phasin